MGGYEFLNGGLRYCLWIEDDQLELIKDCPEVTKRINACREHRLKSVDKGTNKLAERSHQFRDRTVASTEALIIPRVSSGRRDYIPIGIVDKDTIIADSAMAVYDPPIWLFGVLHSRMHMVWVDAVGGKLKTDYRYSAKLCYNTFPLPKLNPTDEHLIKVWVKEVFNARADYEVDGKSIAWMYDPDTMPQDLRNAHHELDLVVDRCYRSTPFSSDSERLQTLFNLYEEMTKRHTLFAKPKRTRKKKQ